MGLFQCPRYNNSEMRVAYKVMICVSATFPALRAGKSHWPIKSRQSFSFGRLPDIISRSLEHCRSPQNTLQHQVNRTTIGLWSRQPQSPLDHAQIESRPPISAAMLRSSLVRAAGSVSCSNLPTTTLRHSLRSPQTISVGVTNGFQTRQAHAISNPTLADIERRWEAMPPQEQADLWMALRDRMKVDWKDLTIQEKKAGMFWYPLGRSSSLSDCCGDTGGIFHWSCDGCVVSSHLFSFRRRAMPARCFFLLHSLLLTIPLSILDRIRSSRPTCSGPSR